MQSSVISISDHFTAARFAPARVQRTFQWDEEQCSTLVDDLLKAWRPALPDLSAGQAPPEQNDDFVEIEALGETDHSGPPSHYYLGPIIIRREGPAFEVF